MDSAAGADHLVQFYENSEHLAGVAAEFLAAALGDGGPAVMIATEAHRRSFTATLRAQGVDVDRAVADGRFVVLDARETLDLFLIDGSPDPDLFSRHVGGVVRTLLARHPSQPLRAYGEMVDVLWREGNFGAALVLEELWNQLQQQHTFSLLCAYVMASFYKEPAGIARICGTHSHIVPSDAVETGEGRIVSALASEIGERKKIEAALREALQEAHASARELEKTHARSERLAKVVTAIAEAVGEDDVLDAVVNQVASAVGASSAGLWILDRSTRMARLARSIGYAEPARKRLELVPVDACPSIPAIDVLRKGEPLWMGSQQELLALYPHLSTMVTPGRSYAIGCLPIRIDGETLGSLGLSFDGAPSVASEEREFLGVVAGYAGQALERLRLLEKERASRVQAEDTAIRLAHLHHENEVARLRTEALHGLAARVINATKVDEVFSAALDAIAKALGAERSSILAFESDGVMRFKAWRGLSAGYRAAVEGHSPWTRDVVAPKPIVVVDVIRDAAMAPYLPLFRSEGIGALAFVPLVAGGRLIGKFMVYFAEARDFTTADIEIADAIANHVAAGLDRFATLEELQQAVRFSELFTGILGHDLRNPLNAIMTAAQLALLRAEDEKFRKPISRILTSGSRMARMINQLLDFTRVRVGTGIPVDPRPLDLVPLLRHVMDELDDANPAWTLKLTHLGDTAGVWDADRLSQVFSNLVANAVQHGVPEHGVHVEVSGAGDRVVVTVRNMGVIPPALLPTLFEPMSGGERGREGSQGLGLGLYISRQTLHAHGGAVTAESTLEGGTTFTVTLPRVSTRTRTVG